MIKKYHKQQQQQQQQQQSGAVTTAVVLEFNGYTFGVWGLSGVDDGTTRDKQNYKVVHGIFKKEVG